MKPSLPPKKDVALALVERSSVFLYLDPRRDGVVVPPWFRKQPELILQVGLNMAIPIPDLRFDDEGVSATLSFKGSQFFCVVPWPSVFAMRGEDGRGMIWPDDLPPEMYAQAKPERPALTDVSEGREAKEPKEVKDAKKDKAPPRGPRAVPPLADASKAEAKGDGKGDGKGAPKKKGRSKKSDGPEQRELPLDVAPEPSPRKPVGAPSPLKPAPGPTGSVGSAGRPQPGKPKRELPPYLRVVK